MPICTNFSTVALVKGALSGSVTQKDINAHAVGESATTLLSKTDCTSDTILLERSLARLPADKRAQAATEALGALYGVRDENHFDNLAARDPKAETRNGFARGAYSRDIGNKIDVLKSAGADPGIIVKGITHLEDFQNYGNRYLTAMGAEGKVGRSVASGAWSKMYRGADLGSRISSATTPAGNAVVLDKFVRNDAPAMAMALN